MLAKVILVPVRFRKPPPGRHRHVASLVTSLHSLRSRRHRQTVLLALSGRCAGCDCRGHTRYARGSTARSSRSSTAHCSRDRDRAAPLSHPWWSGQRASEGSTVVASSLSDSSIVGTEAARAPSTLPVSSGVANGNVGYGRATRYDRETSVTVADSSSVRWRRSSPSSTVTRNFGGSSEMRSTASPVESVEVHGGLSRGSIPWRA